MTSPPADERPVPSLADYTAFHGMLCSPIVARSCIQSFEGSVAMFGDQAEYEKSTIEPAYLQYCDFGRSPHLCTIGSYYILVLTTLTGVCSLFGYTEVVKAIDYLGQSENQQEALCPTRQFKKGSNKEIISSPMASIEPLKLPSTAMDYVIDRSISSGPICDPIKGANRSSSVQTERTTSPQEITLIRHFEFDFGGFFSVMMLHFRCYNGRTHLVEIFKTNKRKLLGFLVEISLCHLLKFWRSRMEDRTSKRKMS